MKVCCVLCAKRHTNFGSTSQSARHIAKKRISQKCAFNFEIIENLQQVLNPQTLTYICLSNSYHFSCEGGIVFFFTCRCCAN